MRLDIIALAQQQGEGSGERRLEIIAPAQELGAGVEARSGMGGKSRGILGKVQAEVEAEVAPL